MSARTSSGIREGLLDDLNTRLANCILRLFSGTPPAEADDAENGTLLVEISLNGATFVPTTGTNGLNFDATVTHNAEGTKATLSKPIAAVWKGPAVAAGTIGWGRLYDVDRVAGASTTEQRIDGTASTATGSDIVVTTATTEIGVEVVVTSCALSFSYKK